MNPSQPTRPPEYRGQAATTPPPAPKPNPVAPAAPPTHPAPRPSITIHFVEADGFDCDVTFTGETVGTALNLLKQASAHLKTIGARPRPLSPATGGGAGGGGGEAPRCKYHGGAMKQGRGGKWFCPKKIQGGAYCDYTVGEDAPKDS